MSTLRRVAVIDCGTNTFNLRIVDLGAAAGWIPVFGQRIPVRLGQGGVAKGVIRPDRMARGLDALVSMREVLRNYKAEEVYVLATSALRGAKNGHEFVDEARRLSGLEVQIISGPHEARLIQEGIALNVNEPSEEMHMTMDIGGGSVEFIVWNHEGIKWSQSFDTGVAPCKCSWPSLTPWDGREWRRCCHSLMTSWLRWRLQWAHCPRLLSWGRVGRLTRWRPWLEPARRKSAPTMPKPLRPIRAWTPFPWGLGPDCPRNC